MQNHWPFLPTLILLLATCAVGSSLSAQNDIPSISLQPDERPIIYAASKNEFSTFYDLNLDERVDSIYIYDRWGNLVHESNEQVCQWNGFDQKERQCPEGFYTIVLAISHADGSRGRLLLSVSLYHDYRRCD
jgi:hypothetical protein